MLSLLLYCHFMLTYVLGRLYYAELQSNIDFLCMAHSVGIYIINRCSRPIGYVASSLEHELGLTL